VNHQPMIVDAGARRAARRMLGVALVFGMVHAVVDAVSAALLTREGGIVAQGDEATLYLPGTNWWDLYLLYSAIAFGLQFPIGAWLDRLRSYRGAVVAAMGMLAAGMSVGHAAPAAAIALVALGNAVFHVGAGAFVLRLAPRRAALAGVFVGPGAIGLAAGMWMQRAYPDLWEVICLGLLAAGAIAVLTLGAFSIRTVSDDDQQFPADSYENSPLSLRERVRERASSSMDMRFLAAVCLMALLLSIALRASVGLIVGQVHGGEAAVLWGLAIAACAGKMLGGLVADRFAWLATSVVTLLLSLPLLSVFVGDAASAVTGMVLFQMTMPVTLMAVYRILPREPGLSFGLASLALLVGAAPAFLLSGILPHVQLVLAALILVSVPAVVIGLRTWTRSKFD
jgi:MFS transporter, FSR family, fosmidomycin resistance protein